MAQENWSAAANLLRSCLSTRPERFNATRGLNDAGRFPAEHGQAGLLSSSHEKYLAPELISCLVASGSYAKSISLCQDMLGNWHDDSTMYEVSCGYVIADEFWFRISLADACIAMADYPAAAKVIVPVLELRDSESLAELTMLAEIRLSLVQRRSSDSQAVIAISGQSPLARLDGSPCCQQGVTA